MSEEQFAYPRILHVALLVCVGILVAPIVSTHAQSEKNYSSSRDGVMYSNEDADGSSLAFDRNDQHNGNEGGYVSHDRWGVDHLTFEGGGGFTMPTGNGKQFMNTGWNIKVGGGYKFNEHLSAILDYDYVSMGVPTAILNQVNPQGGGATHLWSLTINPMYNYKSIGRWGGYIVGGGGFYRKLVNFTQPFDDECAYYDPFYGCIPGVVSQTVAHFSNNAGGANFGTGFTYKLSDTGRAKLFIEGRYVWVDNQPSANSTSSTGYAPTNYRTEYVPITFGIRF
ncbi:MAG: hypothetical protein ACLPM3_10240 [Terracidiphilus sp.]